MQALKPAVEPILCFQVPYAGRPVDSITRTGAGALNVDKARVESGGVHGSAGSAGRGSGHGSHSGYGTYNGVGGVVMPPHPSGRWPANACLIHSPECRKVGTKRVKSDKPHPTSVPTGLRQDTRILGKGRGLYGVNAYGDPDGTEEVDAWECAEGCAVRILGEQSGALSSGGGVKAPAGKTHGFMDGRVSQRTDNGYYVGDSGTAARFYHQSDWALEVQEQIAGAVPWFYCAKASRAERDAGLEGLEKQAPWNGPDSRNGLAVSAAKALIRNPHPCCKPLELCRHLAALLSPPVEYAPRRLLVPFVGVSSEVIGAILSGGWEEIVAVEMSEEYCEIAAARIAYWQKVAVEERAREAERRAQPRLPLDVPARKEKPKQPALDLDGGGQC